MQLFNIFISYKCSASQYHGEFIKYSEIVVQTTVLIHNKNKIQFTMTDYLCLTSGYKVIMINVNKRSKAVVS